MCYYQEYKWSTTHTQSKVQTRKNFRRIVENTKESNLEEFLRTFEDCMILTTSSTSLLEDIKNVWEATGVTLKDKTNYREYR